MPEKAPAQHPDIETLRSMLAPFSRLKIRGGGNIIKSIFDATEKPGDLGRRFHTSLADIPGKLPGKLPGNW
ncbi:MAG: hypothetical protein ACKOB4_05400 [Acidobacteriota bacterium]